MIETLEYDRVRSMDVRLKKQATLHFKMNLTRNYYDYNHIICEQEVILVCDRYEKMNKMKVINCLKRQRSAKWKIEIYGSLGFNKFNAVFRKCKARQVASLTVIAVSEGTQIPSAALKRLMTSVAHSKNSVFQSATFEDFKITSSIISPLQAVKLENLSLITCNMLPRDITVLSVYQSWWKLKSLDLNQSKLGNLGAEILAGNTSWIVLEKLVLSSNEIGAKGAEKLAMNKTWQLLKLLNLTDNRIGDEGVSAIASNTTWGSLETLFLSRNEITDVGAVKLAENKAWKELKTLYLSYNKIEDKGLESIISNGSWKSLQTIYILYNWLTVPIYLETKLIIRTGK